MAEYPMEENQMSAQTQTRIEWTGNVQVHHPVTDSTVSPSVPTVRPEAWTPAPAPCRFCGHVHQVVTVGQAAR